MKSRRAIFFLFVAGFCFLGSLPLHGWQTKVARHAMKERMEALLDESDLQILQFDLAGGKVTDPDFQLRPDGKEFRYHGHHYDIFRVEELAGKVTFWVLQDEREDALLARMQSGEGSGNPIRAAAKTFLKFFGKSFPNPGIAATCNLATVSGYPPAADHHCLQLKLDVHSPPPRS